MTQTNPKWDDNLIQFARLLAEISANAYDLDLYELADSMDLEVSDINELFDRADQVWEEAKPKPKVEATPGPWIWEPPYYEDPNLLIRVLGHGSQAVLFHNAYWDVNPADRDMIAAAPDMLEALEGMLETHSVTTDEADQIIPHYSDGWLFARRKAVLAVEKAKGEV